MKSRISSPLSIGALALGSLLFSCGCMEINEPTAGDSSTAALTAEETEEAEDGYPDTFIEQHEMMDKPDGCVAPSRQEYMAKFGLTVDDKDLSDPNVVAARQQTILFIFDRSGSMGSNWADEGIKWEIANETMVSSIKPFRSYLSAGAVFFAKPDDMGPVADIDSGLQIDYCSADAYLHRWEERTPDCLPETDTPLMEAIYAADDAIQHACEADILERPFKVVLITDGEPTTFYDHNQALSLVRSWFNMGIETQVIGMPGSESGASLLSDISYVGRTGKEIAELPPEEAEEIAEEIIYTEEEGVQDFSDDVKAAID